LKNNMGGQLFSSAGHIAPLLVSRGPHFSQKDKVKAKKISRRGPDVANGPYVAPSWSRTTSRLSTLSVSLVLRQIYLIFQQESTYHFSYVSWVNRNFFRFFWNGNSFVECCHLKVQLLQKDKMYHLLTNVNS